MKNLLLILCALLLIPLTAQSADKSYDLPSESLYFSAYRFLTLDNGFQVTKEDPEMGIMFFTYVGQGMEDKNSAVEIIKSSPNSSKIRINVPSISEGTISMLLSGLDSRIKSDFGPPAMDERIWNQSYENLYSSVYRYLAVDKQFEMKKSDKEKGIILFRPKDLPNDKSYCEIFKMPQGGFKVRLKIASLSAASAGNYLQGISEKLKKDYQEEE